MSNTGPEAGQKLSDAAYAGKVDQLQTLLNSGIQINTPDKEGFTALHRACVTGNVEVIKFLLSNGADVNAPDSYGDTGLHYACFCGHLEAVKALIAGGADPNKPSKDGKTPLQSAREEKQQKVVDYLVQGKVAGLDFSSGVILEGELRKRGKWRKWRKKYYVISKTYGAMFFWNGNRETVEGVIKKVRFETFLACRRIGEKKGGKRFDIKVITGRIMQLEANTPEEADQWVNTIRKELGYLMAVLRVQTAYRVFRARKRLKRMMSERQAAVKRLISPANSALLAQAPNGILLEGPLKKKLQKGAKRYFQAFRTRYFVLHIKDATLYYYESKAKRNIGVKPRNIPFLQFYNVTSLLDKNRKPTKRFRLRVMSGREFEFEAPNVDNAKKWVKTLNSVLPRENVAAVKVQTIVRMFLSRRRWKNLASTLKANQDDLRKKYGKSEAMLTKAATDVQRTYRGYKARKKYRTDLEKRRANEKKAMANRKTPAWLNLKKKEKKEQGPAPATGTSKRFERLKRLKALRSQQSTEPQWEEHMDEESGTPFWYNPATGETTWECPFDDEWEENVDPETGKPFYVNKRTGETRWEKPGKVWTSHVDPDSGEKFYSNTITGETTWTRPEGYESDSEEKTPEGGKWRSVVDEETGEKFYFNDETGQSTWERPEGYESDDGEEDWIEVRDDESGEVYYYNQNTGERSWTHPNAQVEEGIGSEEEDDWVAMVDPKTNRTYYYNPNTGESRWTKPGSKEEAELEVDVSEVWVYSSFVNDRLAGNENLASTGLLPMDLSADPMVVFDVIKNGVVLCHLINAIVPNAVDTRVISYDAKIDENYLNDSTAPGAEPPAEHSAAMENLQLALAAAVSIGCAVGNVKPIDIASGKRALVVDLLWQVMKVALLAPVSVRNNKQLLQLHDSDEEVDEMLRLSPEELLLRWVNLHLNNAASSRAPVNSFGEPFQDGVVFATLCRQVAPDASVDLPADEESASAMEAADLANLVLLACFEAGVPAWLVVEAVTSGNIRLHLILTALLFNARSGLDSGDEEGKTEETSASRASKVQLAQLEKDLAGMMEDENETDSRESRSFRMWLNSLDLERVYVNDLFRDLRDGVILLKALDAVEPGIVNWKRVNTNPKNKYKKIENCNMVISTGKAMEFKLTNVGGMDIVDGRPKMILSFLWQLMRYHTLKLLSSLAFDGFGAEETDILEWANTRVAATGYGYTASGFHDGNLRDSIFLLYLLNSVRGIVNWELVSQEQTEEAYHNNAQYLISVARKMGATVFCTWEDIVDVKPKMILLLVASVMVVENKLRGAAAFVSDEEGEGWVNVDQDEEEYYEADEWDMEDGGGGGGGGEGEYSEY